MTQRPTIYAESIEAIEVRGPGIVRVVFARTVVGSDDTERVLELLLPLHVVGEASRAFADTVEQYEGLKPKPAPAWLTTSNLMTMSMIAGVFQSVADDLGELLVSHPELAERLNLIEAKAMKDARNAVTEGVSIDDEARAMGGAIAVLEQFFQRLRSGPKPDEPDTAGGGE